MNYKVTKSDEEWRRLLTPAEYSVCREKGTEPAFSGEYWDSKDSGTYKCRCCGEELFRSDAKFDSGTGWPSFFESVDEQKIELSDDLSHGTARVEVSCRACGAHLGHVFDDGPAPTGKRYCVNSVALKLDVDE